MEMCLKYPILFDSLQKSIVDNPYDIDLEYFL